MFKKDSSSSSSNRSKPILRGVHNHANRGQPHGLLSPQLSSQEKGVQESAPAPPPSVSTSSQSVLGIANRFPFSSTPAVSPLSQDQQGVTAAATISSKDNRNPTSSASALNGHSTKENNFKKPLEGNKLERKMNVSGISRSQHQQRHLMEASSTSTTASLSPIRRVQQQDIMLTEKGKVKRGNNNMVEPGTGLGVPPHLLSTRVESRQRGVEMSGIGMNPQLCSTWIFDRENSNGNGSVRNNLLAKVPFPFPSVTVFDQIDRDVNLLNNLRLLKLYRTIRIEKEKLAEKRKVGLHAGGKTLKKKISKQEDPSLNFIFTKNMFQAPNTPAFLHVFYLLFECYNPRECETRFRDAWPVYDKKVESTFRRVTLKLLKELLEAHPLNFVHIKPELLAGLINKPGGDRFIQLTECFVELVMSRVIGDLQEEERGVLNKPIITNDSEITHRQLMVLKKASTQVSSKTVSARKHMLNIEIATNQRLRLLEERKNTWILMQADVSEKADNLQSEVRDLLGYEIEMTDKQDGPSCCDDLKTVLRKVPSELLEINFGIENLVETASEKAVQLTKDLNESFGNFNRLWYILGMDRNQERILEGKKLFFIKNELTDLPSLKDFYSSVSAIIGRILEDQYLNNPISTPLLREFKTVDLKFQYLNLIQQDLKKNSSEIDLDVIKSQLDVQIKCLKLKLNGVEWSQLSKVTDEKLSSQLHGFTPLRNVDLSKNTGFTPGIHKFLACRASYDLKDSSQSDSYRRDSSPFVSSINRYLEDLSQKSSRRRSFNPSHKIADNCSYSSSPVTRFPSHPIKPNHLNLSKHKVNSAKSQVSFVEMEERSKTPVISKSTTSEYPRSEEFPICEDDDQADGPIVPITTPQQSDSNTSIGLSPIVQARIARIMGSLSESDSPSPQSAVCHDAHVSDEEDNITLEGDNAIGNRSLGSISRRLTTSPAAADSSNLSLLEEWTAQKGIMDMEQSMNLLDLSDDSDGEFGFV